MKNKLLTAFLVFALIVCFTGCENTKNMPEKEDPKAETSEIKNENISEEIKEDIGKDIKEDIGKDITAEISEDIAEKEAEENIKPGIISARKAFVSQVEWYEDTPSMLARSDYSYILLDEEDSKAYPSLAEVLTQTSNMCIRSMSTEFDNLVCLAKEELELYDGFNTQVSNLDMHIRRSDSVAFSVLSDSYMDTMYIDNLRAIHGTSYDTQTGIELIITDVVKDMPSFSQIVEDEISGNMWGGELYSDTAVKEYFENRTPHGISWCLDYNGVTIFFNRGDIADPVYGLTSVTVSFKEHPEIFEEKYMQVPDSYMIKLPQTCSGFLDLDGDKELDEFIVSTHFDEVMGMYSDIYLVKSTDFYEESICAYGYKPYYVKTADGKHLLYLFVEGSDSWHRLMNMYIYDISGEKIKKLGEVALAPHHDVDYEGTDIFSLPTDPENMYLDYFLNQDDFFYPSFTEYHTVGRDGFPEILGDGIIMDYPMEEDMG